MYYQGIGLQKKKIKYEKICEGDIVVFPFLFSDLILCQITGKARYNKYIIELKNSDFKKGN